MRKLATAAISFAVGVALVHYILPERWFYPCALTLLILIIPALFLSGSTRLRLILLLFFTAAGICWYAIYLSAFVEPVEELVGEESFATVRVTESPEIYDNWARMYVKLEQEGYPSVKLAVYDYGGFFAEYKPGDILSIEMKFVSATERYDEETDIYTSRGILLRAYAQSEPELVGRDWRSVLYFPAAISSGISRVIGEVFPEDVRGFVKALLVGDSSELNEDYILTNALSVAGTRHVVAVSGMHLSLLYGAITFLVGRKRTTRYGIPAILFYMLITGCTASVVRASVMLILVMLAPVFGREADDITSLSAALLLLLIANPMSIAGAGLQLSFAAMTGIILVSPRVYKWLDVRWKKPKKHGKGFRNFVISSISSSLGAIIFTTPMTALTFRIVSLVSPIANIVCLWAVSVAFIGGWIAVIFGLIFTPLGMLIAETASWAARYIMFSCKLIARVPFAAIYMNYERAQWWLIASYACLTYGCLPIHKRKSKLRVFVLVGISLVSLVATVGYLVYYTNSQSNITVMDVGQGQSIVALSYGETLVIDCGGMRDSKNAGDTTAEYLLMVGRRSIDVLALTHLHADHVNGVEKLMSRVPVKQLYMPRDVEDPDGMLSGILELAELQGTEVLYIDEDITLKLGGMYLTMYETLDEGSTNERGSIMLIEISGFEALITGDVNMATERQFLQEKNPPEIELLVVGHHGSKYSTSMELLDSLLPEIAIISVGNNSYGHPTDEALYRLWLIGAEVHRTDLDGNIMLRITDDG